ncbi:hypothetical protein VNF293_26330 [Atlantibacter hermannii]
MRGERGWVTGMPNNTNAIEMFIHFLVILCDLASDNLPGSLETRKLIPIISEPAR